MSPLNFCNCSENELARLPSAIVFDVVRLENAFDWLCVAARIALVFFWQLSSNMLMMHFM